MKIFLIFISGLAATFVLIAGFFYFLFVPPEAKKADLALAIDPKDRFTISGTIVVPPPLKAVVKNGHGQLVIHLFSGPLYAPVDLVSLPILEPKFPLKFSRTFSRADLKSRNLIKDNLTIFATYRFDTSTPLEQMRSLLAQPQVNGRKRIALSKAQVESMNVPEAVDIGNLYLTRFYKHAGSENCSSGSVLLSGKITPSADFLKNNPTGKFALVASPDEAPPSSISQDRVLPDDLDSVATYYQFIDFSNGPVEFSIPFKKISSPFLILTAIKCAEGEALKSCAARNYPISSDASNPARFRITGREFEAPFCGTTAFQAFIHQPEISQVSPGIPEPNPVNAIAPQEFISGENISK